MRSTVTRLALIGAFALLTQTIDSHPQAPVTTEATEPPPIAPGRAPGAIEYSPAIDARHYDIRMTLPDEGAVITGTTELQLTLAPDAPATLALDFSGLSVTGVRVNGSAAPFVHDGGKLMIPLPSATTRRRQLRVAVDYRGTPDDGLIIRTNVHGHRTAFADNWPNRARFWFPSLDYPADKATATFTILAPTGWNVIANGVRNSAPVDVRLADGTTHRRFRWNISEPISTYNMVFGAAAFQVSTVGRACRGNPRCVDVTTWLFPESAGQAAASFRRAPAMVEYFSQLVAPFPYEALAHVQSSTRFGGMENATAIFYDERPLANGANIEPTVAHETAHQWFGDSVTEAVWPDLWLSEGFATYFGALFFEHADGGEVFHRMLDISRRRVVTSDVANRPVIDRQAGDLLTLLNVNTYDKGSWVLHMLRGMLGDRQFFAGIRRYYRAHARGTATTLDLQRAMEAASGRPLEVFFDQWLRRPGFPRFHVSSRWDAAQHRATVAIAQVQPAEWPTFRMPLTLEFQTAAGRVRRRVEVGARLERVTVPLETQPLDVVLDPDGWVLKDVERP